MLLAALSTSLAASPGGFRVGPGLPVRSVVIREAFALDGDWVSQTTLAGRTSFGATSASLDLPVVVQSGDRTGDPIGLGVGLLRAGIYRHVELSPGFVATLGVEAAGTIAPRAARVTAWAVHARDTQPGGEVVLVGELAATPDAPVTVRSAVGFRAGSNEPVGGSYHHTRVQFEFAAARVMPVHGPLSAVVELDLLLDWRPLSGRALLRVDAGDLSVDLGVQVGLPLSAAALMQARAFF